MSYVDCIFALLFYSFYLCIFSFEPSSKCEKAAPITSVAFAPKIFHDSAILAIGLESGILELWRIPLNETGLIPSLIRVFPTNICHTAAVRKISWRPLSYDSKVSNKVMMASCSLDHGVRIFELSSLILEKLTNN